MPSDLWGHMNSRAGDSYKSWVYLFLQFIYWKTALFASWFHWSFFRQFQRGTQSRANHYYSWSKIFLNTFPQHAVNQVFLVWVVGIGTIPGPALGTVPFYPLRPFFPQLFINACADELHTGFIFEGQPPQISGVFSLHSSLLSDTLLCKLWPPWSPWSLSSVSSSHRKHLGLHLDSPPPPR